MKKFNNKRRISFSSFVLLFISIIGIAQTTPVQKFHDTKGNIEVTKAGQLQYTLNIDVPPGVKDVSPNISLIYTSGGQNGLAGYNWNISGLTSISRTGKSLETDGIIKGVQLDYSDYYSFNGQRLILKSGDYGKNGAEYVTEKYSNVKIKSIGALAGVLWQGPEYWEVTFEDGSQAWYGASTTGNSSARTPIDYNIVKSRDINGNYITYNYISIDNVSIIDNIQWGGNETQGTQHFNKIEFVFGLRPMPETAYIKGIGFSQSKILEAIIVKTNNQQYKKYNVSYKKDLQETAYRYLDKITILNSQNEEANPVIFTYEKSKDIPNPNVKAWSLTASLRANNDNDVVGDFDGDGNLDLLRYHQTTSTDIPQVGLYLYTNFYTGISRIFVGNSILPTELKGAIAVNVKKNNLIYNRQGFVTQKFVTNAITSKKDIELSFYNILENNQVYLNYKKVIPNLSYDYTTGTPQDGVRTTFIGLKNVDFNGDGLSELILEFNDKTCWLIPINSASKLPHECINQKRYYVVDPDESLQNNQWFYGVTLHNEYDDLDPLSNYKIGDFNGDGLFDFLKLDLAKKPLLITFQKNTQGQYASDILPFEPLNNQVLQGLWQDGVVGDYNGDGISDIMMPESSTSSLWYRYLSKGNGFVESTVDFHQPRRNRIITNNTNGDISIGNPRVFAAYDINNDGKSELILLASSRYYQKEYIQDSNQGVKYRRTVNDGVAILSTFGGGQDPTGSSSDPNSGSHIVYLNSSNINTELAVSSSDRIGLSVDQWTGAMLRKFVLISMIPFTGDPSMEQFVAHTPYYDISKEARIKTILQGGITTEITYKQLDGIKNPGLYESLGTETYPYVQVNRAEGMYVVSNLTQTISSTAKLKQDFRYRGLSSNILGKGLIGFRKSARSSWYADGFENTKIWSGVEIDPLNEAIPIKEWSIKTNNESQIFPLDVSENNSQLLSFKSTVYQINKILNGQVVTTIASTDKPKIVTAIVPKISKVKDFLTNTIAENTITYEDYYLPLTNVSKINNNYAVTTNTYEYFYNPSGSGSDYFIGRPKSKTEITQAYGSSKSGKNEYTYENNRMKTVKMWNRDNTGYLKETYNYDGFGNLIQKVISNSIDAQTETIMTEYDTKGRFILNKTDNLGLVNAFTYNNFGHVLTQTDPLQNVIKNTYDGWGKLLISNSNLTGTTTYIYEKDNNLNVTVTQYDPDGNLSKTYTNKLGQEYKSSSKAFGQGQFVSKETQYDILGRKTNESEPYFEGQNPTQWNAISYNDSFFPAKTTVTSFNGKQIETSVLGFTTEVKEVNGYTRTTSKTKDPLGNIISSTDTGGTINFAYNAAGEQIEAKYGTNVVSTKYDAWGRKSEFNDPSNGMYTFEYDGLGRAKKTISPKGEKEYTYNNFGQLINQVELSSDGVSTIKNITFTYDNFGRLTLKSGTSNGKPYSISFEYDTFGRIASSIENSNSRRYAQHKYDYDSLSRIKSYDKSLVSSGVLTEVTLLHVYNSWNGELYQLKDLKTGKLLWELQNTNVKGQSLTSTLGEATINNSYDSNGFLTNINHSSAVKPGILQIGYSFNAIKNELNSRTTGGDFTINEDFEYDDNNRLASWTNPKTGQNSNNVYEIDGRILENDQLGKVKYGNSNKIYQATSVELNPSGVQNYTNDIIQYVGYNENNDPVYIDGLNGDVAFQYGLTSMRQRVTYGGNFDFTKQEGRYTKLYSEDGSFEVTLDNETKSEKHILYIGGNPYDSNIVFVKNDKDSQGSYKFLHKDYLGSILAISDEKGQKIEQRHFDAWGNLTHLQIGNGSVYTDENVIKELIAAQGGLLIDRGYTSHEHFSDVKIIHMNGRIYDPLLRRFLNADEHIQDPSNTQNYNKYGYVMNNPMMYNDPNGEFWWWAAGAIAGGYLSGVNANGGNWNPGKWNWEKTWSAVLGGAIGGASISGALGNIASNAGAIKSFLPGIISGGLNSAFTGSNFLGGAIGGISYSTSIFDNRLDTSYTDQMLAGNNINFDQKEKLDFTKLHDEILTAGLNPWDRTTYGRAEELMLYVPTIRKLANAIRSRNGVLDVVDVINMNGAGETNIHSYLIKLKMGSFNNFNLVGYAFTLGHELIHSFDLQFNMPNWKSEYGAMGNRFGDLRALREVRAYDWEMRMGKVRSGAEIKAYDDYKKTVDESWILKQKYSKFKILNPWK